MMNAQSIFLAVVLGVVLPAEAQWKKGLKEYRKVDGQMYEVNGAKTWEGVSGRVNQVLPNGMLLVMTSDYVVIGLRNYPFRVVDDDRVSCRALQVQDMAYKTVLGATKTIRVYDYGEPVVVPQKVIPVKAAEQTERERTEAAAKEKRTFDWTLDQALAGLAWAQYDVGIRYRDGKGVGADKAKSKEWLEKAAAQGHAGAKSALTSKAK